MTLFDVSSIAVGSVALDRECRNCGKPFVCNASGAGTAYCSLECKRAGYTVAHHAPPPTCVTCGQVFERNVGEGGTKYCSNICRPGGAKAADTFCAWCGRRQPPGGSTYNSRRCWPYVCRGCLDPIFPVMPRLRVHHVSIEMARKLRDNPYCEVCGVDVLTRRLIRAGTTHRSALLAIDHDHACCPGPVSCGNCIRGFLCRDCNIAEGALHGDAARAEALARYMRPTLAVVV